MEEYYIEIIKEIELLISNNELEEAFSLVEEELLMPYIPKESEDKLVSLYNDLKPRLQASKPRTQVVYDEEGLVRLLNGSLAEGLLAYEFLKEQNIRKYLELISNYLSDNPHYLLKALFIELIIEQEISDPIKVKHKDMEVEFIPTYIESAMEADGAIMCADILVKYFENENPSFLQMCIDSLVKEAFYRLPENIDEDEALGLALGIIRYVFKANNDTEHYNEFIMSNKLDKVLVIDLLLEEYDSQK